MYEPYIEEAAAAICAEVSDDAYGLLPQIERDKYRRAAKAVELHFVAEDEGDEW